MNSLIILLLTGLSGLVNPFIGASTSIDAAGVYHGLGKTFPGATTPYGMAQSTPVTVTGGDNGPGYSNEHTTLQGFAMTAMSGIGWYGDLGNFMVLPVTGAPEYARESTMVKPTEKGHAGYYSVATADGILSECTASPHCGVLRFSYPSDEDAFVQIDLNHRSGGCATEEYCTRAGRNAISGWIRCTPSTGGWGHGAGNVSYTLHYYASFSSPVRSFSLNRAGKTLKGTKAQSDSLGCVLGFGRLDGPLEVKVGISFVDDAGALLNWKTEAEGRTFDQLLSSAESLWDDALSIIEIETPSSDYRTIFYTALYHTMIDPRLASDVDGRYPGGDGKVKMTGNFKKRTIFSGWDVFRSQFPLQTIINPELVSDMINSLVTLAEESGKNYLERWELLNAYSGCMLGNPAVSVLADAFVKGIRSYDIRKAYEFAKNTCDWDMGSQGSISEVLECAYSDWCLSVIADGLGEKADAAAYLERSRRWRGMFNPVSGWFQPKDSDGAFIPYPKEGRLAQGFGSTESNPYQQGWFVPHEFDALVELLGGREETVSDLEWMFSMTPRDYGWNDWYNHANEPVQHIPFLFNRLGRPDLTQYWTRDICENAYKNCVEGLVGNEDVGQMSAWYVLASIGMHPVCPGDPRYELTAPLFDRITVHLPSGKDFTVNCTGNGPGKRKVASFVLNGTTLSDCSILHSDIVRGGTLSVNFE